MGKLGRRLAGGGSSGTKDAKPVEPAVAAQQPAPAYTAFKGEVHLHLVQDEVDFEGLDPVDDETLLMIKTFVEFPYGSLLVTTDLRDLDGMRVE